MPGKARPPNSDLLDELAADFGDDPEVTIGTMFRRPGLRAGGKIVVFLGFDGELIAKLPRDRGAALIEAGEAEPVAMGERTMREWFRFPAGDDTAATLERWREVTREAHRFVTGVTAG